MIFINLYKIVNLCTQPYVWNLYSTDNEYNIDINRGLTKFTHYPLNQLLLAVD